jgi:hypothetical protein
MTEMTAQICRISPPRFTTGKTIFAHSPLTNESAHAKTSLRSEKVFVNENSAA